MDADIEFGDFQANEPQTSLRPDESHYYAVEPVGEANEQDLRIYVDLDVMRELEDHAFSNTQVELGGVLMGRQLVDGAGVPFVVVEDSIRAQHYEATRGSFKFTHDTWRQITEDRQRLPGTMKMVGWYHTHPGWGVFLSGMDDFICQNFFNQPLDLALVIDPCQNDRGWFQWTTEGTTRRCESFFLIAHRHREEELREYIEGLNERETMKSGMRTTTSRATSGGGTTVQVIEREHRTDWPVVAVLGLQFLVMLALLVKLFFPATGAESVSGNELSQAVATIERLEAQKLAYREALAEIVQNPDALQRLVEQMGEVRLAKDRNDAAIASHLVRIGELEKGLAASVEARGAAEREVVSLNSRIAEIEARGGGPGSVGEAAWVNQYGIWFLVSGLVIALGSAFGAAWWVSRRMNAVNEMLLMEEGVSRSAKSKSL
ncbi:MAG: Mov34/MPN/PAD-1 family protein [Pirellulaceae bacterium]|nr:Mov34/MPN/PAD-1 family protein [Pirellulaceae bacterium]